MIQLLAATVLVTIMPKHCAEFRDEPQSLCNEISAILGGHDALPSPIRHFGDVSPCPRRIYATGQWRHFSKTLGWGVDPTGNRFYPPWNHPNLSTLWLFLKT